MSVDFNFANVANVAVLILTWVISHARHYWVKLGGMILRVINIDSHWKKIGG